MSTRWLLLDMHNLGWRTFHVLGGLNYRGEATGVVFGLLRDIIYFADYHATSNFVFAFDVGESLRKKIYPKYKAKRHGRKLSGQEAAAYGTFRKQITDLRENYLPRLGYKNILYKDGYEADDMIAAAVNRIIHQDDEAVIVSQDKDLFQLLGPSVSMWDPKSKKLFTHKDFKRRYGIKPDKWSSVKALAGCVGDEIAGVPGVGEKTALAYLKGELPKGAKLDLIEEAHGVVKQTFRIVNLPFEGTPPVKLKKSKIDRAEWEKLTTELGFGTLFRKVPGAHRGFKPS